MIKLDVQDIVAAVEGSVVHGPQDGRIDMISLDTRALEPGGLFIPIKGDRFDGHDFLHEAVKKGAKVIFTHKDNGCYRHEGVTVIRVKDTLKALHRLARWYRTRFHVDFIAVTGSAGKTTTKNIIATLLEKRFKVLRTPGNYNNQIGLPMTVMDLDYSHRLGVVEMGMSGYGEIEELAEIVKPRVAVITNIGMSHIEKLGSREGILRAKMEIFQGMDKDSIAVINADDELLRTGCKDLDIPIVYYGLREGDFRAKKVLSKGVEGMAYTLLARGETFDVVSPLPGIHNVYNSLAAIAVARHFGIGFDEIIDALGYLEGESMRLSIHSAPGGVKVINDAYNASPESMEAALKVLKDAAGKRKIALLADILEMGRFSEDGHRFVGRIAAETGVDVLITVGRKSRFIALEAKKAGMKHDRVYSFDNKRGATELLKSFIERGDIVLVKGSRGMQMEELVEEILERGQRDAGTSTDNFPDNNCISDSDNNRTYSNTDLRKA